MAKYLVLGATGQTGAATAAALIERTTVRGAHHPLERELRES
jgi:uncharacterized protein YbjT (DUF2867 family)